MVQIHKELCALCLTKELCALCLTLVFDIELIFPQAMFIHGSAHTRLHSLTIWPYACTDLQ